ncbi:hypothetical protein FHL15_004991 [Xylaria flabelliformis]|uniref:Uncharacterized protein n=1 Tax=Xylaria flabelliformis TaxID=2512241 RepID=A0A553I1Z7_9PEZI|nr:hypothetical protein FHL15_004991 [Xylaria flabelliformis]
MLTTAYSLVFSLQQEPKFEYLRFRAPIHNQIVYLRTCQLSHAPNSSLDLESTNFIMCVRIEKVTVCKHCDAVLEGPTYAWDPCGEINRTLGRDGDYRQGTTTIVMPKTRECTPCMRRREDRERRERERAWADEYRDGGGYTW